jgi:hypothetical protein
MTMATGDFLLETRQVEDRDIGNLTDEALYTGSWFKQKLVRLTRINIALITSPLMPASRDKYSAL